jgi:hypothetical protein
VSILAPHAHFRVPARESRDNFKDFGATELQDTLSSTPCLMQGPHFVELFARAGPSHSRGIDPSALSKPRVFGQEMLQLYQIVENGAL